jgi:hypothetical protein
MGQARFGYRLFRLPRNGMENIDSVVVYGALNTLAILACRANATPVVAVKGVAANNFISLGNSLGIFLHA